MLTLVLPPWIKIVESCAATGRTRRIQVHVRSSIKRGKRAYVCRDDGETAQRECQIGVHSLCIQSRSQQVSKRHPIYPTAKLEMVGMERTCEAVRVSCAVRPPAVPMLLAESVAVTVPAHTHARARNGIKQGCMQSKVNQDYSYRGR